MFVFVIDILFVVIVVVVVVIVVVADADAVASYQFIPFFCILAGSLLSSTNFIWSLKVEMAVVKKLFGSL